MVDYLARYWGKIQFEQCGRAAQVSRLAAWADQSSSGLADLIRDLRQRRARTIDEVKPY